MYTTNNRNGQVKFPLVSLPKDLEHVISVRGEHWAKKEKGSV